MVLFGCIISSEQSVAPAIKEAPSATDTRARDAEQGNNKMTEIYKHHYNERDNVDIRPEHTEENKMRPAYLRKFMRPIKAEQNSNLLISISSTAIGFRLVGLGVFSYPVD